MNFNRIYSTRFQNYWNKILNSRYLNLQEAYDALIPTISVTNPTAPEHYANRNDKLSSAGTFVAGVLANFSQGWLINDTPNLIVCVEGLLVGSAAADSVLLAMTQDVPAGTTLGVSMDSRTFVDRSTPVTLLKAGAMAKIQGVAGASPIGISFGSVLVPASASIYIPVKAVLTNGYKLLVQSGTANVSLSFTWQWYERQVEPFELTT